MKYSCDHCSYETSKKANLIRHLNRKFKCYEDDTNVALDNTNVAFDNTNVALNNIDNISDDMRCKKCNKLFLTLHGYKKHISHCNGIQKLQCEICLKSFSSRFSKSRHKRFVLCYPPHVEKTSPSSVINNNNNNTHNGNNINNQINNQIINSNNNNTIYNTIQYNAFGDEGIQQLEKFLEGDSRILERLKQVGGKKLYGVRDIQNDIFFNPENPKGFSIIKPDKHGSSVRIRNSEGDFEYMEFNDIRDPLFNYIEKYIEIYNNTRNKYKVTYRDLKERRILHDFLKIMTDDLDIYLNEDLKDDLGIDDNLYCTDDENNNEEEIKYKQFDKLSLDHIHTQTKKFFKCKKGEFVLKNEQK